MVEQPATAICGDPPQFYAPIPAEFGPGDNLIALAIQHKVDTAALKDLMAMKERYDALEARKAWVSAMTAFKAAAPSVLPKDAQVDFTSAKGRTHYNHTTLGLACKSLTPLLSKHGLTATWMTKQEADKANLTVTCRITHEQGHGEDTTLTGPYDVSGNKNPIQAIGSAATYLARYTFLLATGIATSDMGDDDGIGAGPRVENEGRGAAGSPRDDSSPSSASTPPPPSSAGAPTPPPWHEDEMPFGKHKGVKFCDLPGDYLDWLSERPPDPKYKPDARTKAIGELEYRAQAQAGQSAPAAAPAPSGCPDGFGPDSRPHGGEYPGVRIRHMPDAWLDRAAKHPGQWGEVATAERDRRKQCGQRPIAEPVTSEARASFAAELRNGYEPSDDGAGCEEPPLSYPPDDGEVEPGELEPELAEDILLF